MKKQIALGTFAAVAVAASATFAPLASAGENPFQIGKLESGYQLAQATDKKADGKCGEAKCGADKKAADEKKAADKKKDGACGGDKKKDGSCGAKK